MAWIGTDKRRGLQVDTTAHVLVTAEYRGLKFYRHITVADAISYAERRAVVHRRFR